MPIARVSVAGSDCLALIMARPRTDIAIKKQELVEAAEALLAIHGASKVTVSDVSAYCNMSQSNAYRFFPTKAALMTAVATRWFEDFEQTLSEIAQQSGPAEAVLKTFLLCQLRLKRDRFDQNPKLFQAYLDLAAQNMDAVRGHVRAMSELLQTLVDRWLEESRLTHLDGLTVAHIIEDGTLLFRDPYVIARRRDACTDVRACAVIDGLLEGIRHPDEERECHG